MTIKGFFAELKTLNDGEFYFVDASGAIRHKGLDGDESYQPYCPITWVCLKKTGSIYGTFRYNAAARELGLSHAAMNAIVDAADHRHDKYSIGHNYRKELLEALQLTEE